MSWHFWVWPLVMIWFFGMRRGWDFRPRGRRYPKRVDALPDPVLLAELDSQRNEIGGLEARMAELENRLDFAERLLAGQGARGRDPTTR